MKDKLNENKIFIFVCVLIISGSIIFSAIQISQATYSLSLEQELAVCEKLNKGLGYSINARVRYNCMNELRGNN